MQALLFEVEPRAGHEDHYFSHTAALRPLLAEHEGLLFLDRFKSLSRPGIILSHSHWRDEAALAKWRTDAKHQRSQTAGRNQHFKDYRIRISHVLMNHARGTGIVEWTHDGGYRDPGTQPPRLLTIIAAEGAAFPDAGEVFRSVNFEDAYLSVGTVETEEAGTSRITRASQADNVTNAMLASVSRDYGMFDRAEAPQYFPDPPAHETDRQARPPEGHKDLGQPRAEI